MDRLELVGGPLDGLTMDTERRIPVISMPYQPPSMRPAPLDPTGCGAADGKSYVMLKYHDTGRVRGGHRIYRPVTSNG